MFYYLCCCCCRSLFRSWWLLTFLRRRVGAPEASALDLVMCILFNSSSNEAAQWVASALLACAALHVLLACMLGVLLLFHIKERGAVQSCRT
jgi:hypothetical protein